MTSLPARLSDKDIRELQDYLRALGGSEEEISATGATGGLGPLALDLVMRPAGKITTLDELAADTGFDPELLARLWLAYGLPRAADHPFPVTPDLAEALKVMVGFAQLVGFEQVLGFVRVAGSSVARMAEALSALMRIAVEAPQRAAGTPYVEVVKGYTETARDDLPAMLEPIGALFRRHLVLVSHQNWSTDEEQAAVALERTVGFADLVGSTETLRRLVSRVCGCRAGRRNGALSRRSACPPAAAATLPRETQNISSIRAFGHSPLAGFGGSLAEQYPAIDRPGLYMRAIGG